MSIMALNKKQYTIHQVSLMLEVPKPTLRFWESELGGIIDPIRTPGGQRRYNDKHVYIINNIKTMRENGKTLSEIKEKLKNTGKPESKSTGDINIDFLADRVSQLVKSEVLRFFERGEG